MVIGKYIYNFKFYSGVLGFGPGSRRPFVGGPGGDEDALEGLGELAQLTVTNDADSSYDVSNMQVYLYERFFASFKSIGYLYYYFL